MKHAITRCTRWHAQWQCRLICVAATMLFFVLPARAQNDVMLPAVGGGGGSEFVARCPEGKLLTGFELIAGDWVNAIRPQCVTDYGLYHVSPPEPYPSMFGSNDGGRPVKLLCSDKDTVTETYTTLDGREHIVGNQISPIVLGMYLGSEGKKTVTVNRIHLICGVADPDYLGIANRGENEKIVAALLKNINASDAPRVKYDGITHYPGPESEQRCPPGLVAVGIHGRSGVWLDST